MATLRMDVPDGWSLGEKSEFTPYGWQDNVTLTHIDCGHKETRAIHSLKDIDGVGRELYLAIDNHRCKPVVYLVMGGALETVWTSPEAAIEANEAHPTATSYIAVRPLDSSDPTPASTRALEALRKMERDRHNARAERIRGQR